MPITRDLSFANPNSNAPSGEGPERSAWDQTRSTGYPSYYKPKTKIRTENPDIYNEWYVNSNNGELIEQSKDDFGNVREYTLEEIQSDRTHGLNYWLPTNKENEGGKVEFKFYTRFPGSCT